MKRAMALHDSMMPCLPVHGSRSIVQSLLSIVLAQASKQVNQDLPCKVPPACAGAAHPPIYSFCGENNTRACGRLSFDLSGKLPSESFVFMVLSSPSPRLGLQDLQLSRRPQNLIF